MYVLLDRRTEFKVERVGGYKRIATIDGDINPYHALRQRSRTAPLPGGAGLARNSRTRPCVWRRVPIQRHRRSPQSIWPMTL